MNAAQPLPTIEFRVDGTVVESVRHASPPRIGETVELGAQIANGDRLEGVLGDMYEADIEAESETVLRGEVVDVTRHYHTSFHRSELTVSVDVDAEEIHPVLQDEDS